MKVKYGRNFIILTLLTLASLGGTVEAMQFSQPVKIGSYYNARAGGPSLARGEGYTKMTNNQCTFGKGENALIFTHKNIYSSPRNGRLQGSSMCTGVYVGKQKLDGIKSLNGTIYKIVGNHGETFYFVYGGATVRMDFGLIGLCEESYYHAIKMEDLIPYVGRDLRFLDSAEALHLSAPMTRGDKILVDVKDNSQYRVGQFTFKWDEQAQWFGIEYQNY